MPDAYNALTHPIDLADGRILASGELADVDLTVDHNARLVADGTLAIPGEAPAAELPSPYAELRKPELEELVAQRELQVQGTGKDGAVTVPDLRAALEANDQSKED